jgi:hypothetical protein
MSRVVPGLLCVFPPRIVAKPGGFDHLTEVYMELVEADTIID